MKQAGSEITGKETLKEAVLGILEEALGSLAPAGAERPPVRIEYARDEKFGDYACTVAMDKQWRDLCAKKNPDFNNPRKFAEAIKAALESGHAKGFFSLVEVAGPGFLNLTLDRSGLFEFVRGAGTNRDAYGKTSRKDPRNIVFEYVSANPTGPLNVVSARAAALGDSCCNLLEAAGDRVLREYYVNDYGNQVNLLGVSCLLRHLEGKGVAIKFSEKGPDGSATYKKVKGLPFPSEGYHGEYLKDVTAAVLKKHPELTPPDARVVQARKLAEKTDPGDDFLAALDLESLSLEFGKAASNYFLETHQRDLAAFRVKFDNFYRERGLHESDSVLGVRKFIEKHLYEEDGKTFFRSTDYGDDKDRVVVREDGRPTYLLADIAYHKTKIDRGYSHVFNIWGPDHHGYIRRLAGAMEAMGFDPERFKIFIAQQVNLLEDGKPIVMSKRTGKFITMETLVEEIPVDVSRYFFVMRSFESHLDFDFTEARDTSEKNPYYYVAYAHARVRSIFAKAAERGLAPLSDPGEIQNALEKLELTPERRRLLWLVARFPEEVRDAADNVEPHRMVNYLYQLATALSKFYGPKENRIIEQDPDTAGVLLMVLDGVAVCLKNGLALLGMEAPERMVREEE